MTTMTAPAPTLPQPAPAPAVETWTCQPADDEKCFTCGEPVREVLAVPCPDQRCGCDRGLCLDCATGLGYPID